MPALNNLLEPRGVIVPESMETVFTSIEPHGVLTAEVISALRHMLGERDITEFATMPVHVLANEITARREACGFPTSVRAGDAAKALLEYMRMMEYIPAQPVNVTPAIIKVVRDKMPAEMSLLELLEALAGNSSRYHELLPFIEQDNLVRQAAYKTPNWAVATIDGQHLDSLETLAYIKHLALRTSLVRAKVTSGRRPTSLARIFGQEERPMFNPFATTTNEVVVTGPIWENYDLGNLDEDVHLAYWWALQTSHRAWPRVIDLYDHVPAAFAEELTGRWAEIVDDYRAAKAAGDESTLGLSRYAPSGAASRRPFGGSLQRDEAWYRAELEKRAGRGVNQTNESIRMGRRIVRSLMTTNSAIHLDGTIVLENIETTNSRIRGRAYVPIGAYVSTTNASVTPDIYEMTWQDLYNKAVELGIITE